MSSVSLSLSQVEWQRASASRATSSASPYVQPISTSERTSPGQRATRYAEKSPSSATLHLPRPSDRPIIVQGFVAATHSTDLRSAERVAQACSDIGP